MVDALSQALRFPRISREVKMSLLGLIKGKGPNGFGFLSTADDVLQGVELSDKVFLVTGVNSGLGLRPRVR